MNLPKKITVTIDANGNVKVEAHNFHGKGCSAATKAIEEALGATASDVKKSEFFAPAQVGQGRTLCS